MITSMRSRFLFVVLGVMAGLSVNAAVALAWTGPTASAPNSNVSAPVNVGTTAQVKNGDLGVNNISVFGNGLMSGLGVGTGRYLNFDYTSGGTSGTGSSGYGIRDNAGTIEYKNLSGDWSAIGGTSYWTSSGGDIYSSNVGNVGIGDSPNGNAKLEVRGALSVGSAAPFAADTNYYANGNYIMFGHSGTSEDFIGYKANTFYFADATGGGDATQPNVTALGNMYAGAFLYNSDQRLKEKISALPYGLSSILALKPVSFSWKEGTPREGQDDLGFIAQEVEKIVPEIVTTGSDGIKSVDYPRLVPILVKAVQDQQAEIDVLKAQVAELRERVR
jgi:trimeric autotransporter adhesin